MTTFISLASSATMFPINGTIDMSEAFPADVQHALHTDSFVSALNPSHKSTLDVIVRKFGIALPIPERAPKVVLTPGDTLLIIQAELPRLNEGEVHNQQTVEAAKITFRRWSLR